MLGADLDRGSAVVALGGGVVSDLAGFVAATYMRGIPWIAVSTTLLGQVDASVGGKTGVDHPRCKNLIGAFHQPSAVLADVATLATLPEEELRTGLAEVVKHAMIRDAGLWELLEARADALLARDPAVLETTVARNVRIKADVVMADEREADLRRILNYGHTVGHALESLALESAGRLGGDSTRIVLDTQDYRSRRERALVRMANQVAEQVRRSRDSQLLEPLNPFERRLIHTSLARYGDIETMSEGDGLYKRIRVIYRGDRDGNREE